MPNSEVKQLYWERVSLALMVLGHSSRLAASLRADIDLLPSPTRELFYHSDPFDVARDLAGMSLWPEEQFARYSSVARGLTEIPLGSTGFTPLERHVLLFRLSGRSPREASASLGMTKDRIRMILSRLRKKLQTGKIEGAEQSTLLNWRVTLGSADDEDA